MKKILKMLDGVTDTRQQGKIKHKIKDIIMIVFFATIANVNEWTEIQAFMEMNEDFLKKYLELPNGIPSHDTIQRVMAIVPSVFLQSLQQAWNEMLLVGEGEKLKKILAIDGKTMRGNGNVNQNPLHVVSAVATEHGLCFGQTAVKMKENEMVAIPVLLRELNIKNTVVTIDVMGTQTEIAKQIISQKGDYILALKGNQNTLYQDVKDYFGDKEFVEGCNYYKTVKKARSQIEVREYWQTDDINWLSQKAKWEGS
jgi:Transposase